jgi:hypothetical protein
LVDEIRLSIIDESNRDDHSRLTADDTCYYLFEYTSHRGYSLSSTNQLIANLKKKPSAAGQQGYHYKVRAIAACARHLGAALNPDWLAQATLVPVPGSKVLGHPDHDDRIERICRAMRQPPPDVRALVVQTESTTASHEAEEGERVTVENLLSVYEVDETLAEPAPSSIAIIDDVLTAGTHFRAMQIVLSTRFPNVPLIGLFVARRVFPDDDFEFDDL